MYKNIISKTTTMLALTIIILSLTACSSAAEDFQPPPRPVAITPQTPESISVRGVVESTTSRNIYSNLGFTINHVTVEVGDPVTEGTILAVLDTADLELSIAQLRAELVLARQNSQTMLEDTARMLNEAEANLNRGANIHIVGADAALNAAALALEGAQINYASARRDYDEGSDPHIISAESLRRNAALAVETLTTSHENLILLYNAGILPREEFRQSENALTAAQNHYNDAATSLTNALQAKHRILEQLSIALQAAQTSYQDARGLANATRLAARQEINILANHVELAEIAANLEPLEIALQILERQMKQSVITSPINGTVTAVFANEGASGLGLLFVIEDTENLQIVTRFREYDIALIETGMNVVITASGTGSREHMGIINRINPAAVLGSPIVEFESEILVVSQDTGLRIGMSTRLDIKLNGE